MTGAVGDAHLAFPFDLKAVLAGLGGVVLRSLVRVHVMNCGSVQHLRRVDCNVASLA